jgi:hypothetical protein
MSSTLSRQLALYGGIPAWTALAITDFVNDIPDIWRSACALLQKKSDDIAVKHPNNPKKTNKPVRSRTKCYIELPVVLSIGKRYNASTETEAVLSGS